MNEGGAPPEPELTALGDDLVEVRGRILDVHPELPADVRPLRIAERRYIDAANEGADRAARNPSADVVRLIRAVRH